MKMYYWNKDNFESLARLAQRLRQTKELSSLSESCELREKGLRKQALAAVRRFLAESITLDDERKLELAIYLVELHWDTPEAHQFLTQPLLDGFILPVLREAACPGNAAFRNLALLQWGDESRNALGVVLQHNPEDTYVRKQLAESWLGISSFAMHHLHESCFLGSEEDSRAALDKAEALLEPFADQEEFHFLLQKHEKLSAQLEDWLEYKKSGQTISFPEWCISRGRNYCWNVTVYY